MLAYLIGALAGGAAVFVGGVMLVRRYFGKPMW